MKSEEGRLKKEVECVVLKKEEVYVRRENYGISDIFRLPTADFRLPANLVILD